MAKRALSYLDLAKLIHAGKRTRYQIPAPEGFKSLGAGGHRTVLAHPIAPEVVFKIGHSDHPSNRREWEFWQKFRRNREKAKLLVPCIKFYEDMNILVQRKAKPLAWDHPWTAVQFIQNKLGIKYVSDVKPANCGTYGGKIKLFDYGISDHTGKGKYWT